MQCQLSLSFHACLDGHIKRLTSSPLGGGDGDVRVECFNIKGAGCANQVGNGGHKLVVSSRGAGGNRHIESLTVQCKTAGVDGGEVDLRANADDISAVPAGRREAPGDGVVNPVLNIDGCAQCGGDDAAGGCRFGRRQAGNIGGSRGNGCEGSAGESLE